MKTCNQASTNVAVASPAPAESRPKSLRFEVLKGERDATGKVHRVKAVGIAYLPIGSRTYTIFLKTFVNDVFYLLPETRDLSRGDYGILTRVPSPTPNRKYIWNNVGSAFRLEDNNFGLLHLQWDLFGAPDIYMSLIPEPEAQVLATKEKL